MNYGFYMGFTGLADNLEEIKKAKILRSEIYGVVDGYSQKYSRDGKIIRAWKFVIVHAEDEKIIQEHQEKYK